MSDGALSVLKGNSGGGIAERSVPAPNKLLPGLTPALLMEYFSSCKRDVLFGEALWSESQ